MNTLMYLYIKWVKKICPHICLFCKYRTPCRLTLGNDMKTAIALMRARTNESDKQR